MFVILDLCYNRPSGTGARKLVKGNINFLVISNTIFFYTEII